MVFFYSVTLIMDKTSWKTNVKSKQGNRNREQCLQRKQDCMLTSKMPFKRGITACT